MITWDTWMTWIIVALALAGAVLNAARRVEGFYVWVLTNAWLAVHNYSVGEHAQAALWLAYLVICVAGIARWRRTERKEGD